MADDILETVEGDVQGEEDARRFLESRKMRLRELMLRQDQQHASGPAHPGVPSYGGGLTLRPRPGGPTLPELRGIGPTGEMVSDSPAPAAFGTSPPAGDEAALAIKQWAGSDPMVQTQDLARRVVGRQEQAPSPVQIGQPKRTLGRPVARKLTENTEFQEHNYYTPGFEERLHSAVLENKLTPQEYKAVSADYDKKISEPGNVAYRRLRLLENEGLARTEEYEREQERLERAVGVQAEKAEIGEQLQNDLAVAQKKREAFHQIYEKGLEERMARLDNAISSYEATSKQGFMSEGGQIASVIFMTLLGKLGQGALRPIIEAKVQQQRNRMDSARMGIEARSAAIRHFEKMGLDKDERVAAYEVSLWRNAKMEIDRLTAASNNVELKQRAGQVKADLEIEERRTWDKYHLSKASEEQAIAVAKANAAARLALIRSRRADRENMPLQFRPVTDDQGAKLMRRFVKTGPNAGLLLAPEDADTYKAIEVATNNIIDSSYRVDKLIGSASYTDQVALQAEAQFQHSQFLALQTAQTGSAGRYSMDRIVNDQILSMQGVLNKDSGIIANYFRQVVGGKELNETMRERVKMARDRFAQSVDGQQAVIGTAQDKDGYAVQGIAIVPRGYVNLKEQMDLGSQSAQRSSTDAAGIKR